MTAPERIWVFKYSDQYENPVSDKPSEDHTDKEDEYVRADIAKAKRDAAFAMGVEVSHYVARTSTGKIASEIDDLRTMTPLQAALALPEVRELVGALSSIARNTCCEGCQEAALVARAALAKLEAAK